MDNNTGDCGTILYHPLSLSPINRKRLHKTMHYLRNQLIGPNFILASCYVSLLETSYMEGKPRIRLNFRMWRVYGKS